VRNLRLLLDRTRRVKSAGRGLPPAEARALAHALCKKAAPASPSWWDDAKTVLASAAGWQLGRRYGRRAGRLAGRIVQAPTSRRLPSLGGWLGALAGGLIGLRLGRPSD
jgi:hypothetical protein